MMQTATKLSKLQQVQYWLIEELLINKKDYLNDEDYYAVDGCLYNHEVEQFDSIIEWLKLKGL